MQNVLSVAKWFLSKESMTPKKLEKLCYYAQAWYVALFDNGPLFEEEIQAWVHGPAIVALRSEFQLYRWWKIIPRADFDDSDFADEEVSVLEAVYRTYSPLDGEQLEALTHHEEPWIKARGDKQPWETSTAPISLASMREYYGKKYEEAQND